MKFIITICISILLLACDSNSASKSYEYASSSGDIMVSEVVESPIENISGEAIQQKRIKESFLKFETEDVDKTYADIQRFVKQNKGFIQNDNTNKGYNQISRSLEIRIPTNGFEVAIDSISKTVSFFDTKRISSKDVTEEFIDLEARLKAKRTLETRYLELLSKAKNVKDILDIERELSTIREDIEAKQGRLRYLTNKVSLSTINVEFYKMTSEAKITQSYGSKMWRAIVSGFHGISEFFLGLLYIWPLFVLGILVYFIIKRILKKRNKTKQNV